ncbi:MAG: DegT/DnrJ/EryC1/StrS family aminotransferase [Candidatus Micrarchaeota archaeon]
MKIPLYKPYVDEKEKECVNRVIDRGYNWTNGPENEELEQMVCKLTGSKYALSMNNGTCALHAMLFAHEIGPGDEIIVPSFTFIATANSPLFVGAKPVFADIEKETYALDPEDVRGKITKKTKAIMPIHYGGCPAIKTKELKEIADEKGLLFIEDAAESLGAKIDGKMVGTFGDSAMYSLCGNKIITSGEGGIVVTNEEKTYQKLKLIRSHGRNETENYFESAARMDYIQLGYNFRMPTIVAALAIAQLKKLDKIIEMRRKIAKQFDSFLSAYGNKVRVPYNKDSGLFNVYQMYSIVLESEALRDRLKNHLTKNQVATKIYFDPIHKTHFYSKVLGYKDVLHTTEDIARRELTIPIYPGMTDEEVKYVCEKMKGSIE